MLKLIKGIFLFLLFGIVLIIAFGAVFVYYFDANDYKDQFISYVEKHSKRSVELETLNLSLFPSLGIAATGLQIGENPAFGDTPFLEAQEIRLGLRLLPLLRQEAQVDGIVLKGIKANVVRNTQGQFNFDDLKLLVGENQKTTEDTTVDASQAVALTSFGGIALQDGYLLWDDRLNDTRIAVDNLNFNSGALSFDEFTPISLDADINSLSEGLRGLNAQVALNTELLPNLSTGDVKIGDMDVQVELTQTDTPLVARVNAEVDDFELRGSTLSVDKAIPIKLDARADGLSEDIEALSASLKVKAELLPNLSTGDVKIGDMDVRVELTQTDTPLVARVNATVDDFELTGGTLSADQAIPIELDARAEGLSEDIEALAASLKVKAELLPDPSAAVVQLNNLNTSAQVEGLDEGLNLQFTAAQNKALLKGDFAIDRFKVSYGDMQVEGRGKFSDLYENPKVDIAIPALDYDALQLKQILLTSSMVDDRVMLNLQRADFHQGRISANAELNSASNTYQMRLSADQVPIDKIQSALSADRQATVRGQAQIKLALRGTLGDYDQILATSAGKADVRITEGALQDQSLAAIVERVVALFEGRSRRTAGKELIFDEMNASVLLNKGIAKNDDLAVQMPLLDVKGAGQVNLVNSTIDYMLHTRLKSAERIQIPIHISGNLESPEYKPDLSNLIKDGLLNQSGVKEKVEEKIDDVEQKIKDKIKGDLLEGLKDKLKLPF